MKTYDLPPSISSLPFNRVMVKVDGEWKPTEEIHYYHFTESEWSAQFFCAPSSNFGKVKIIHNCRVVMEAKGVTAMSNAIEMVRHWRANNYYPRYVEGKCLADYSEGRRADVSIRAGHLGKKLGGEKPQQIKPAKPRKAKAATAA